MDGHFADTLELQGTALYTCASPWACPIRSAETVPPGRAPTFHGSFAGNIEIPLWQQPFHWCSDLDAVEPKWAPPPTGRACFPSCAAEGVAPDRGGAARRLRNRVSTVEVQVPLVRKVGEPGRSADERGMSLGGLWGGRLGRTVGKVEIISAPSLSRNLAL